MQTSRLKNVPAFDIESFIQEIPIVKQVFMKWDTDSFIDLYMYKTKAMNIYSEPLVNYVILWQNRDFQFVETKLWFSIYPESCSSSLHISPLHIIH